MIFTNKHDGCYERPEYFKLELFHKGSTTNCMIVDHVEVNKYIYNPDDKETSWMSAKIIEWIKKNCIIEYNIENYLPGLYTLILKKRDINFLNWVSKTNTLGVRIPNNDFCDKIRKVGKPFITTSVNLSGENSAISIKDINKKIIKQVDEVIDNGKLNGKSSTLIIDGKEIKR